MRSWRRVANFIEARVGHGSPRGQIARPGPPALASAPPCLFPYLLYMTLYFGKLSTSTMHGIFYLFVQHARTGSRRQVVTPTKRRAAIF